MTVRELKGLPLPEALSSAIEDGRWTPPDRAALEDVFSVTPEDPSFYTLDYMRFENGLWLEDKTRTPMFGGTPDAASPPGDIDVRRSVLIGDLGHDMPFALDYRPSLNNPSVVYFRSDKLRWITVAASIEDLLARLGLSEK